jgi:predicted Zn-dependent peptidase
MKITSGALKETYYFNKLSNGLSLAFIPKKGLSKKSAMFAVEYGALDLEFKPPEYKDWVNTPSGVAHFLEHLMFKKETGNIMQEFAQQGANYNASTGYTMTVYFYTSTENFDENLKLLLKLVFEPYFTDEGVAKEKHIIEQEVRMYQDMPDLKIARNLAENLYHKHPIRLDIGGTPESIQAITPQTLKDCYNTFYHPANMIGIFAGDIDREKVIKELEKYFKNKPLKSPQGYKIARKVVEEPTEIRNLKTDIKMAVARPRINIGYKDRKIGLSGVKLMAQNICTDLMMDCILGKSSELYNRLYADGVIDDTFGFNYEIHPTYGMAMLGGEAENPDELYGRLLEGIKRAKKKLIKKRDLNLIKRKFIGRFVRLFDAPEQVSFAYIYYHFNNIRIFDTVKYIKRILLKDVLARLEECLDETQHAISIIRPKQ